MWYGTSVSEDHAASILRVKQLGPVSGYTYTTGSIRGDRVPSRPTGNKVK
jgi:hypothetical protein